MTAAPLTLWVLANPAQPELKLLEQLPDSTNIVVGDSITAFERTSSTPEAVFAWFGQGALLSRILPSAPRLRWVHSLAVGLDDFLFTELVDSAVVLTNGRGAFNQSLGEFVIAAILFFAKNLRLMVRNQEEGEWRPFDVEAVRGRTLGIVGYGDIGRAIAQRARALEMRILAWRRRPELSQQDPLVDEIIPPERKLDLISRSDYLALAAPLTDQTRHMISTAELHAMKQTAVIINVGRGSVIDETALVEVLREGRIRGAALDVFAAEPLPAGHPFFSLKNVLLSPHCADHTTGWLEQGVQLFLDNFERFRAGQPLQNVVEKKHGY